MGTGNNTPDSFADSQSAWDQVRNHPVMQMRPITGRRSPQGTVARPAPRSVQETAFESDFVPDSQPGSDHLRIEGFSEVILPSKPISSSYEVKVWREGAVLKKEISNRAALEASSKESTVDSNILESPVVTGLQHCPL